MNELRILTTENDLYTHDISQMGDFFNVYISNLKNTLEMQSKIEDINISPATIEVLAEVINFGIKSFQGTRYIADFGSLPIDIQKKFNAKKLVLQKSNKVVGNNACFLVDPNKPNEIVANLTLKKVLFDPDTTDLTRNMMIQMQLKQIGEKLDCIDEKINYQIQRDRDHELMEPFFVARDYIRNAQASRDEEEREKYLYSAIDYLKRVYHAAYLDLETSSKFLSEKVNPLLLKQKDITKYMIYMCEDIYMMNKSIGLELQIYEYQNKKEEAKNTLLAYSNGLIELSEKEIGVHGETAIGLLQDYYPYNNDNMNMWINFLNTIKELREGLKGIDVNTNVLLLCAEA